MVLVLVVLVLALLLLDWYLVGPVHLGSTAEFGVADRSVPVFLWEAFGIYSREVSLQRNSFARLFLFSCVLSVVHGRLQRPA